MCWYEFLMVTMRVSDLIAPVIWAKLINSINSRILQEDRRLVAEAIDTNIDGFYRPKSKDGGQRVSIRRVGDAAAVWFFDDPAEGANFYIDLTSFNETPQHKLSDEAKAAIKAREESMASERANRHKKVAAYASKMVPSGKLVSDHPVFRKKKLPDPGSPHVFYADRVTLPGKNGDYEVKDVIISKYYSSEDVIKLYSGAIEAANPLCVQYRKEGDVAKSMAGSIASGAYCPIKWVKKDSRTGLRTIVIAEGVTTATAISLSLPDVCVVAAMTLGQMKRAYAEWSAIPGFFVVLALDKAKNLEPHTAQDALEAYLRYRNSTFIQPPKKPPYCHMTDFADIYTEKGPEHLTKLIERLTSGVLPKLPEILEQTELGYECIATNGVKKTIREDKLTPNGWNKEVCRVAPWSAWYALSVTLNLEMRYDDDDDDDDEDRPKKSKADSPVAHWLPHIVGYLNDNLAGRTDDIKYVGIFQEKNNFIANLNGARYLVEDGEINASQQLKPYGDNSYIAVSLPSPAVGGVLAATIKDVIPRIKQHFTGLYTFDDENATINALLGYLAQGYYSGFSHHRANMWAIGSTGSGKSKLSEIFLGPLSSAVGILTTNSTDNGLRQEMTAGAMAHGAGIIICDEAAQDTTAKEQRGETVIAMSRESASGVAGMTASLRGQQTQKSLTSKFSGSFFLSSTTHHLVDPQDLSRYLVLDMQGRFRPENDKILNAQSVIEDSVPGFIKVVLLGADRYNNLYGVLQGIIREKLKKDAGNYSHRVSSIAAVVAGWGSLLGALHPSKATEQIAKKAYTDCKSFIEEQLESYMRDNLDLEGPIDRILNTYINDGMGIKTHIIDCLSEKSNKKAYKASYGLHVKEGALYIQLNRPKALNNLLSDRQKVLNPFRVSTGELVECALRREDCAILRTSIRERGQVAKTKVIKVDLGGYSEVLPGSS